MEELYSNSEHNKPVDEIIAIRRRIVQHNKIRERKRQLPKSLKKMKLAYLSESLFPITEIRVLDLLFPINNHGMSNHSQLYHVDQCYTHAFNISHIKRVASIEIDLTLHEYRLILEEKTHEIEKNLWKGIENWEFVKNYLMSLGDREAYELSTMIESFIKTLHLEKYLGGHFVTKSVNVDKHIHFDSFGGEMKVKQESGKEYVKLISSENRFLMINRPYIGCRCEMNLTNGSVGLTQYFFNQHWLDFHGIKDVRLGKNHIDGFAPLKHVGVTSWKRWYWYILANFDIIAGVHDDLTNIMALFDQNGIEIKCKKYHFLEEYIQDFIVYKTSYFVFDVLSS